MVWGSGFRVWGSAFRVQDSEIWRKGEGGKREEGRGKDLGLMVRGLGFGV
jgi:hypothetical protein